MGNDKGISVNHKLVGINIVSFNPKRLADFYHTILGADINENYGGPNRIEVWFGEKNDSTVCIVVHFDAAFKPQTYNTCQGFELRVTDVDAEYMRICDLGVKVSEPPRDLPWGYRFFHIKDPDGNGIDIVAQLEVDKCKA